MPRLSTTRCRIAPHKLQSSNLETFTLSPEPQVRQTKKELKDLVDICAWEGKEYMAIAQSLERAQRQLVTPQPCTPSDVIMTTMV